jgi:hypothetical protein
MTTISKERLPKMDLTDLKILFLAGRRLAVGGRDR